MYPEFYGFGKDQILYSQFSGSVTVHPKATPGKDSMLAWQFIIFDSYHPINSLLNDFAKKWQCDIKVFSITQILTEFICIMHLCLRVNLNQIVVLLRKGIQTLNEI